MQRNQDNVVSNSKDKLYLSDQEVNSDLLQDEETKNKLA